MSKDTNPLQLGWKFCPLFTEFNDSEFDLFEKTLTELQFENGEQIISEGDPGDAVFFIESGEVEIRKEEIFLAKKSAPDYFGAMALLDKSVRSASVFSVGDTVIKKLSVEQISAIGNESLYNKIFASHLRSQQSLLRNTNEFAVTEAKAKLEESESRVKAGNFFFYLLLFMMFYQFMLGVYIEYGDVLRTQFYKGIVNPVFMILLVIIAVLGAKEMDVPLRDFGLNMNNWQKNLKESLIWTASFLSLCVLGKWLAIQFLPAFQNRRLFETAMDETMTVPLLIGFNLIYMLVAPTQEFLIRGAVQSNLKKMLVGGNTAFKAILVSNLIFSATHLHMDLSFAFMTFIPGMMWGFMFERQGSIFGSSVSHVICGMFFFLVLGGH